MHFDAEVFLDRIETLWRSQLCVLGLEFGDVGNHLGRNIVAAFGTPLARQQTGKSGRLQGILGLVKGWPRNAEGSRNLADGDAVDHWNAEAMGWHVAKMGNRYAAAQAVGMAIKTEFGAVAAGIARGLALRHDHGSAFMADHFQNQIKFWGMAPSFAFVGEPETNGVAEQFFRTFKEQVIHGRIYQTIDDVRAAVRKFFELYNAQWLIEKNGLRSPRQTRFAWEQAAMNNAA